MTTARSCAPIRWPSVSKTRDQYSPAGSDCCGVFTRPACLFARFALPRLIYPDGGPTGPYYHRHADPVIPVWWRVDQLAPLAARAIGRYQQGHPVSPPRNPLEAYPSH